MSGLPDEPAEGRDGEEPGVRPLQTGERAGRAQRATERAEPDVAPSPGRARHPGWLLIGAVVIVAAVAVFDLASYQRLPVLEDATPSASLTFLVRGAAIAVAAVAAVVGLVWYGDRRTGAATTVGSSDSTGRAGVLRLAGPGRPANGARPRIGLTSKGVSLVWPVLPLLVAVTLALLVAVDPATVTRLALEDGPVENASAAMLLAGAVVAGWRTLTVARDRRPVDTAVLGAVTLGMLVLAGEEISWGQRILGFGTPEALAGNLQDEANLHNLFTDPLELLFAALTVALFVVAPLAARTPLADRLPGLAGVVPTVPLLLTFAPATAFNYDMWNMAPVQLGFWLTCAALTWLAISGATAGRERDLAVVALVVCVGTQVLVLLLGGRTERPGDVLEHRELITSIALAAWAISLTPQRRDDSALAPSG